MGILFQRSVNSKKSSSQTRRWGGIVISAVILALLAVCAANVKAGFLFSSFLKYSVGPLRYPCQQTFQQKLTGAVQDCGCDYETVDQLNNGLIFPTLQEMVKKPFFRYFKVRLFCDCPFWEEEGLCHLRDCSVCECPENEFPEMFKGTTGQLSSEATICQEGKPQATVDRTLDSKVFQGWTELDNPWTYDNEADNAEMTFVNLLLNPERYTGYSGPSAHKIWENIYQMNCFKDAANDVCKERRVLYRLISGLHSSISVHIAREYLLDAANNVWGPNLTLLDDRVIKHPDRVENLYFTFLFVLRAVNKAADFLLQAEYNTGNKDEDIQTQTTVTELLTSEQLKKACPIPFDEAQLWQGEDALELKNQLQHHFRNISALMDCVACEKCRLWGKLQVLGLGTALKILFSDDGLNLQRNEVIALINLLSRLSESIQFIYETAQRVVIS